MTFLKLILLAVYAVGVASFCISSLRDVKSTKKPKSVLGWYGAIILPLLSALGAFAHFFNPTLPPAVWYVCLGIWISAWLAFFFELRDLQDHDEKVTLITIIFGLFLIGLVFGPGLFLGGAWLFQLS